MVHGFCKFYVLLGSAYQYRFGPYKKTQYHLALLDMYKQYGPVVKVFLDRQRTF